jgi:hypothetical protein
MFLSLLAASVLVAAPALPQDPPSQAGNPPANWSAPPALPATQTETAAVPDQSAAPAQAQEAPAPAAQPVQVTTAPDGTVSSNQTLCSEIKVVAPLATLPPTTLWMQNSSLPPPLMLLSMPLGGGACSPSAGGQGMSVGWFGPAVATPLQPQQVPMPHNGAAAVQMESKEAALPAALPPTRLRMQGSSPLPVLAVTLPVGGDCGPCGPGFGSGWIGGTSHHTVSVGTTHCGK